LLASMPARDQARILRRTLQRYTPRTIVDPRVLSRQLERVREDGYAFTLGELEVGLNAVAAPVRHLGGQTVAVVSVSGPSYRVTPQALPELGERTRDAADAISRRLGAWPDLRPRTQGGGA